MAAARLHRCVMQPLDAEQQVIDAADALARALGWDDNHAVAVSAMDIDGRIHEAVNVYHFEDRLLRSQGSSGRP
jgi:hypothetical protein